MRTLALVMSLVGCLALASGVFAIDIGIDKVPCVNVAPMIDGVPDLGWSGVKRHRFDMIWAGESSATVLELQLARDTNNFYGLMRATTSPISPTNWGEWQIGDFVVICFAASGWHRLPFQASDSEIVVGNDAVKLCRPADNWSLVPITNSAIVNNASGFDAEFSIPLSTLSYTGNNSVGLAAVLRKIGLNGHPVFVGSIENSPIAVDFPSTWQSVPMEQEYSAPWVIDRDFKSSPDGIEVQCYLAWHVTDSDGLSSFSCQHPRHQGWLEVSCLPSVPCPPKDAIVTHLRGTFITDVHDVRRLLACAVDFFGGLPVVPPVGGNSKTLSALNAGLFFSLTGRVTSTTTLGFVVDDGGVPIAISGELPIGIAVGDTITVCGTSHLGGNGPHLGLKSAIKR